MVEYDINEVDQSELTEVTNYKQSSVFFGILWFIKKGNLNKPSENSVFQMEGVNL